MVKTTAPQRLGKVLIETRELSIFVKLFEFYLMTHEVPLKGGQFTFSHKQSYTKITNTLKILSADITASHIMIIWWFFSLRQ
jgi:hypothetical protein